MFAKIDYWKNKKCFYYNCKVSRPKPLVNPNAAQVQIIIELLNVLFGQFSATNLQPLQQSEFCYSHWQHFGNFYFISPIQFIELLNRSKVLCSKGYQLVVSEPIIIQTFYLSRRQELFFLQQMKLSKAKQLSKLMVLDDFTRGCPIVNGKTSYTFC